MCRTSDNAAKPAAVTPVRTIPKSPPKGPLLPFRATPYGQVGAPDAILQSGLDQAVTHAKSLNELGPNPQVAFSIILIAQDGTSHKTAEVLGNEMFFSASLLKVAAMYPAYELGLAVRQFADAKGKIFADALAFFKALSDEFDPQIKAAALPQVVAKAEEMATKFSAQDIRSTPAYKKIFQVTGFSGTNPLDIEFKTKSGTTDPNEFADNLEAMIEQSSDPASRETIKTLSYSYINAALTKAGFFAPDPDPKRSKGMWLCGDYSFGADPFLDFQFGQDTMKVQVTTARQISRLFALVHLKKLVSDRHSQAMQDLLSNSNLSFLSTITPPITDFDVVLRKVGVDSGRISEGELLKWSNTTQFEQHGLTGEAAMCWHNLRSFVSGGQEFKGILRVIRETVAHYLNNAP